MPYYSGDYYQGDSYYQAGGLFGSIGKLLGGVAKTALSLTPVGKAVQIARTVGRSLAPLGGVAGAAIQLRSLRGRPAPEIAPSMIAGAGMLGGGGGGLEGLAKFGRSRRMNVTNVRALRRAGRRVRGFLKLARRFGALPISPKGKKLFKAKRGAKP